MAFPQGTILQLGVEGSVNGPGDDTNGGGVVPSNSTTHTIDYSRQSRIQLSGLSGTGANAVTLATTSATLAMVGNIAFCLSGANVNTSDWYPIIGAIADVSLTFDVGCNLGNPIGTSDSGGPSGATINIGGPLATFGAFSSFLTFGGNVTTQIPYSPNPYLMGTPSDGSSIISGNPVIGYYLIPGDDTGIPDTPSDRNPTIKWNGGDLDTPSSMLFSVGPITNVNFDGSGSVNVNGLLGSVLHNSLLTNFSDVGSGVWAVSVSYLTQCKITNSNIAITVNPEVNTDSSMSSYVWIDSCVTGILDNQTMFSNFLITNTGTAALAAALGGLVLVNSTIDGCTVGFDTNGEFASIADNVVVTNTTAAWKMGDSSTSALTMRNCAGWFGNGTDLVGTPTENTGYQKLTDQPYMVAGSDYRPNAMPNGGAILRNGGAKIPGQLATNSIGAFPSPGSIQSRPWFNGLRR